MIKIEYEGKSYEPTGQFKKPIPGEMYVNTRGGLTTAGQEKLNRHLIVQPWRNGFWFGVVPEYYIRTGQQRSPEAGEYYEWKTDVMAMANKHVGGVYNILTQVK